MENDDYIYESILEFEIEEYIAVGGESIVFKGIKRNVGRTYALKFQPIYRYNDFHDVILKFHQKLEQSSVSRIAGLIPEVSERNMEAIFELIPPEIKSADTFKFRPDERYFCIIEDYIQGCNLKEYCHGSARKRLPVHCPDKNAPHAEVMEYQKTILNWIVQFCDIMTNITEDKGIIHLDIKPENIMITEDTRSLVLVDFGSAMELKDDKQYDLNVYEFSQQNPGDTKLNNVGTYGFAAPEAYHPHADDKPPFGQNMYGHVDERSDIFSFGATLWNCLTPDLVVRASINYRQYYNRDLFAAPTGYSPELENIIIKCTQREPVDRYRDFKELKEAAMEAEKKLPSSYQTKKTRRGLWGVAALLFVFGIIFLFLNIRSNSLVVQIDEKKLEELTDVESNNAGYEQAAVELLNVRANDVSYDMILQKTCMREGDTITKAEVGVLMTCLRKTSDKRIIQKYVDTIMEKANPKDIESISDSLSSNEKVKYLKTDESEGRALAQAISNLRVGTDLKTVYHTMMEIYNNAEKKNKYAAALNAIIGKINSQTNLQTQLMEEVSGLTKEGLLQQLNSIKNDLNRVKGKGVA